MSPVRFTAAALRDLQRIRDFLRSRSPAATERAARAIIETVSMLARHPRMGRLVESMEAGEEVRELMIFFGDSGYVARYHFDGRDVTVLALRHAKETGE